MDYKEMEAALANAKPATFDAAKSLTAPAVNARDAALVNSIVKAFAPHVVELEKQIAALSARVAELERSQKTYLGVWKSDREYSAMSEVTHDGARWYCCKSTSNKPGESADWVMQEKSAATASPRSDATTVRPRENGHYSRPRSP